MVVLCKVAIKIVIFEPVRLFLVGFFKSQTQWSSKVKIGEMMIYASEIWKIQWMSSNQRSRVVNHVLFQTQWTQLLFQTNETFHDISHTYIHTWPTMAYFLTPLMLRMLIL